MGIVIRNGEVVTASSASSADLRLDGGTITAMGTKLEPQGGDETIDATGQFVLPGFIDPHVHMELGFMGTVSADDFEVGTASGVAGGTTCIIDFCIPAPGESMLAALDSWRRKAAKAVCDYSFHMAITSWGERSAGRDARGRPGARHHRASRSSWPTRAPSWWTTPRSTRVMREAAKLGAVVTVHAENGDAVWHLQRELVAQGLPRPRVPPRLAPQRRSRARRPNAR